MQPLCLCFSGKLCTTNSVRFFLFAHLLFVLYIRWSNQSTYNLWELFGEMNGGGGSWTLPPPRPKSPPRYPDLYGKRRGLVNVQIMEREIGFLEEELKYVERLQPASRACKEIADFVLQNADPLIPITMKTRRSCSLSCGFWTWLCKSSCFNVPWICCCGCYPHLEAPQCSDCNLCNCKPCSGLPRCRCCSCSDVKRFSKCKCSLNCCICKFLSCSICSSKCCTCSCPNCSQICNCCCTKRSCCFFCF